MNVTLRLLEGFGQNLYLFFVTLILSLPLGLLITFLTTSKFRIVNIPAKLFVWVIRGTPLMLQLYIIFFVPGLAFGWKGVSSRMGASVIAFVINYAAYFSEIYRGGIEGIPRGQYEAGRVLGLTERQVFFKIVLFQVIKRITAPIGNEIITLVKDTSLARILAVSEIIFLSYDYTQKGIVWPLFYTGVYFLIFNGILTLLFGYLERKLDYYKG